MILSPHRRTSTLAKAALLTFAFLFALAACSDDTDNDAPMSSVVRVVATTNIMADWVENVGGDHVDVFSLVPVGADPHAFQPGARDVSRIADADLVLSVGLGLEGTWLKDLLQNAARDPSTVVEVGEVVDPIEFAESHADDVALLEGLNHVVHEVEEGEIGPEAGLEEIKAVLESAEGDGEDHGDEDELPGMILAIVNQVEDGQIEAADAMEAIEALTSTGEGEHSGHGHGIDDPHFWLDPLRVKRVVNEIAARLSALDPERGETYAANASAYNARLDELHSWTESQVDAVPADRRMLVTSHDSLGYFANLYGFEVVGVILSITTEVVPSAEGLGDLVETVKEYSVPAVFGETTVSERLATSLATESGAKLVRLYSGTLGPEGSGAETYIEMTRTNVSRISEALK